MEFMETVKGRRSIRKYKSAEVPQDILKSILEAVRWTPSWANTQCWEIVVITDKDIRQELQKTISPKNPSTLAVVQAPVLIAVCGRLKSSGYYKGEAPTKFGDWFLFDLGLATQNLCLAAHAYGLGTVVVGMFDHDKANEILRTPAGYEVVALIPLGYPDQSPKHPKRREIDEFSHLNSF